jgi:hypothetical protein
LPAYGAAMNKTNLRIIILAVAAATVLAVPAAAQAASPTVDGYAPNGAQVQADVSSGTSANGDPLRQLPFTGFDLWFAAAGGLLLGLAGLALRRAAATPAKARKAVRNE